MLDPPRRGWPALVSGRRLAASLLGRPWLVAVAASALGGVLALAIFFGQGYRGGPLAPVQPTSEVPPQAALSSVDAATPTNAEPASVPEQAEAPAPEATP